MGKSGYILFCAVLFALLSGGECARYKVGDDVKVYANTVGPYDNPAELYSFFTSAPSSKSYGLAWCPLPKDQKMEKKETTLAERLEGDRPVRAPVFNIKFLEKVDNRVMCERKLGREDVERYIKAIERNYYYEFFCDDLPIYNLLGYWGDWKVNAKQYVLFSHFNFNILYNTDRIIAVNMTVSATDVTNLGTAAKPSAGVVAKFSYSVRWNPTAVQYKNRDKLLMDSVFFRKESQVHWLSIMNSLILALLLTGFMAVLVIRIVKNDFAAYQRGDALDSVSLESGLGGAGAGRSGRGLHKGTDDADDGDDDGGNSKRRRNLVDDDDDGDDIVESNFGWKLVHSNVFRFPKNKTLFCALVGTGAQFVMVALGLSILSLIGVFTPGNGGVIYVSVLVLYAIGAGAGGFVANRLFRQMGGQRWAWVVVLVTFLYPLFFSAVFLFMDFVAVAWKTTSAMRFTTMLQVSSIYTFVGIPMTFIGSILGRHCAGDMRTPCRTSPVPREIPDAPWYRSTFMQMLTAGVLPFSAIFVELFYVYTSAWGHVYYSLYGVLVVVFFLLVVVSTCVAVVHTYFSLEAEDYRWWWSSFANGGSTALYILFYSVFYWSKSPMHGFLQGVFFFGSVSIVAVAIFIMLGALGFYGSLFFVRYIYSRLKID